MRWILALGLSVTLSSTTLLAQTDLLPVQPVQPVQPHLEPVAQPEPHGRETPPLWAGSPAPPLHERVWVSGEYIHWWVTEGDVPPLATTGPQDSLGILGAPGTSVLFGGQIEHGDRSGARFTGGLWFTENRHTGFEASGFFVGKRQDQFAVGSAGDPLLARPLTLVPGGFSTSELIGNLPSATQPGRSGNLVIAYISELFGVEGNFLLNCCETGTSQFDVFAGFRHVNLRESIAVNENVNVAANALGVPAGTRSIGDSFRVENEFYGGQIGARYRTVWSCFELKLQGRLAVGATEQEIFITGATQQNLVGAASQTFTRGILATLPNRGNQKDRPFGIVPEAQCEIGWNIRECVRLTLGYTFLYWNSVIRPGEQINLNINPGLLQFPRGAGDADQPAFRYNRSDVIIQGLSCGLELRF